MGKETADDLTIGYNPKILAAIKTIGQGLMDLADALVAQGASEQPEPRPGAARSPSKKAPPPAEEPQDGDDTAPDDETEEVKLADLQKMAKDLIKADGRPKLIKILEDHELENVSSAPAELWPTLKRELEEASE